ncbi:hypothetical protein DNTS_016112 [Danionella cerebrum]|uniref:Uncharacterized protein n=1 Tax=Danionella cerebrum TaxID=2873325 RepID=A0A553Q685_9TELE|nr:hypothetical protein DNTS_016112 [Danionella translucida]
MAGYFTEADSIKQAKGALTQEVEKMEALLNRTTPEGAEMVPENPHKAPHMEAQPDSCSSRKSSLKGLFAEILQEHDEERGAKTETLSMCNLRLSNRKAKLHPFLLYKQRSLTAHLKKLDEGLHVESANPKGHPEDRRDDDKNQKKGKPDSEGDAQEHTDQTVEGEQTPLLLLCNNFKRISSVRNRDYNFRFRASGLPICGIHHISKLLEIWSFSRLTYSLPAFGEALAKEDARRPEHVLHSLAGIQSMTIKLISDKQSVLHSAGLGSLLPTSSSDLDYTLSSVFLPVNTLNACAHFYQGNTWDGKKWDLLCGISKRNSLIMACPKGQSRRAKVLQLLCGGTCCHILQGTKTPHPHFLHVMMRRMLKRNVRASLSSREPLLVEREQTSSENSELSANALQSLQLQYYTPVTGISASLQNQHEGFMISIPQNTAMGRTPGTLTFVPLYMEFCGIFYVNNAEILDDNCHLVMEDETNKAPTTRSGLLPARTLTSLWDGDLRHARRLPEHRGSSSSCERLSSQKTSRFRPSSWMEPVEASGCDPLAAVREIAWTGSFDSSYSLSVPEVGTEVSARWHHTPRLGRSGDRSGGSLAPRVLSGELKMGRTISRSQSAPATVAETLPANQPQVNNSAYYLEEPEEYQHFSANQPIDELTSTDGKKLRLERPAVSPIQKCASSRLSVSVVPLASAELIYDRITKQNNSYAYLVMQRPGIYAPRMSTSGLYAWGNPGFQEATCSSRWVHPQYLVTLVPHPLAGPAQEYIRGKGQAGSVCIAISTVPLDPPSAAVAFQRSGVAGRAMFLSLSCSPGISVVAASWAKKLVGHPAEQECGTSNQSDPLVAKRTTPKLPLARKTVQHRLPLDSLPSGAQMVLGPAQVLLEEEREQEQEQALLIS